MRAFAGPAFLVSVGYMDPGNWGTDLKGGAHYRYDLLWVVAAASFMAIIMQVIAARLGIVTGKDLAQACRDFYPAWTRWPNWIFCEIAIAACDLAEVLGSAVAINLLFPTSRCSGRSSSPPSTCCCSWPCKASACGSSRRSFWCWSPPSASATSSKSSSCRRPSQISWRWASALVTPGFRGQDMIVVAIGIIGATVMPHNLYLHSALVQSRQLQGDEAGIQRAIRFNTIDTVLALSVAFFVNAAILVLAAMVFHGKKRRRSCPNGTKVPFNDETDWIIGRPSDAGAALGNRVGEHAFCRGAARQRPEQHDHRHAGRPGRHGRFHALAHRPWLRRMITRSLAILPGDRSSSGCGRDSKRHRSSGAEPGGAGPAIAVRHVPALALREFAEVDGEHSIGWFLLIAGWISRMLITALDIYGLPGPAGSVGRHHGHVIGRILSTSIRRRG